MIGMDDDNDMFQVFLSNTNNLLAITYSYLK